MEKPKQLSDKLLTVLHVDDHKPDRDAVSALINAIGGIRLISCHRPGHIAQIAPKNLDVSIVDLDYDGKIRDQEVIGKIRNISPSTEIIVLSNFGQGDATDNPYGAFDVIAKADFKASPAILLRSLENLLNKRSQGSPPPPPIPVEEGFEAMRQNLERAVNRWRTSQTLDLKSVLSASFEWALLTQNTSIFVAALVASIAALICTWIYIPMSGFLVIVTASCVAIAFQSTWHIVAIAKVSLANAITATKAKPKRPLWDN